MRNSSFLGVFFLVFSLFFSFLGQAKEVPVTIPIFIGKVFLVDQNQNKIQPKVGQSFTLKNYPWIELAQGAKVFLKLRNQLIQLEKPQRYSLSLLFQQKSTILQKTLTFFTQLTKPRLFVQRTRIRGSQKQKKENTDQQLFNKIWKNVVQQEKIQGVLSINDLIATAGWFYQQKQPERVAYLLDRLTTELNSKNEFYQKLRGEAFRATSFTKIQQEVEKTKREIRTNLPQVRYQALLIGVSQYENAYWETLKNPIRDVKKIRDVLIQQYQFKKEDVLVLENPTFGNIIQTFRKLKKSVDQNTHLLIYYAGHGYYPEDEEEGYWIPKNAGTPISQRFFIPTSTILSKIKALSTRHTLLIADSCFSGSLIQKTRGHKLPNRFYSDLVKKKSRQIITSGGLEPVQDQGGGRYSVFAGKFIQILSQAQKEPISASELAILLRKKVKNTGVAQTPQYGRLPIADEEQGEFFFVHKDLKLNVLMKKNPRQIVQNQKKVIPKKEQIISKKETFKFSKSMFEVGMFFHMINFTYNAPESSTSSNIRVDSEVLGMGLIFTHHFRKRSWELGTVIAIGRLTSVKECVDNNAFGETRFQNCEDNESQKDNSTSLSGDFFQIGGLADYSVYTWTNWRFQVGGEIHYQYLRFRNYLSENVLATHNINACVSVSFPYENSNVYLKPFLNLCIPTVDLGGSFSSLQNTQAEDPRLTRSLRIGISTGFSY
ncbi:MAG: hypothetical protein ACI86H_000502 [bacterium]|jgi:hypothetical protein